MATTSPASTICGLSVMSPDDLPFLEEYIRIINRDNVRQIAFVPPEDYIALLRENARLRAENERYNDTVRKYGEELFRAIRAEDKLKYLRQFLLDAGITVPGFRW